MEVQESIVNNIKAVLDGHFAELCASQKELKSLLIELDAKLEAVATAKDPLPLTTPLDSFPVSPCSAGKSDCADVQSADSVMLSRAPSMADHMSSIHNVRSNSKIAHSRDDLRLADPTDDREELEMRSEFQENSSVRRPSIEYSRTPSAAGNVVLASDFGATLSSESLRSLGSRFRNAWSPDSRSRKIFDLVGMIMVLHDAFMVPFWLAWDFPWSVGFWITSIFWTIDLPSQFVTGYRRKDGRLELSLGKTALYYTKTWFLLDAIVVLCDWISALGKVSATMRYLRLMRMVRGGRQVLRFFLALQTYKMSSQSTEVHLMVDISFLLGFILWVNHVVCCGWYGIGAHAESDTGWTWIRMADVSDVGTPYTYSTSLHWALTQMTPASMEVVPKCTIERVFNVLIIIVGMILGSVFAATLTSSMTQYRLYKERVSNNFMQLQSYLRQQGVEPELSMSFKMHVKNQLTVRQRLLWKNVEYISLASRSLREALWHSCCMKCIRRHSFLHCLNLFDSVAVQALCNGAMTTALYSRGDIIFEVGAEAHEGHMYNIVLGHMFYDPGPLAAETHLARDDSRLHVSEGAFVSEAALWVVWKHLGTLFVKATTEVLGLSSSKLQKAIYHRFPDVMAIIVQYCAAFHASLHEIGSARSDLGSAVDNLYLMSLLETGVRLGLAKPVLEQLKVQGIRSGRKRALTNLEKEIQEGTCNIGFADEEPVRTTFVVAMKLHRAVDDDRFLVKIGEIKRDTGEYKAACVLPGTKRKGKETSKAAVERIVKEEFAVLLPFCRIMLGGTQTVFLKNSPTYGLRTRYLRSTYNAVLDSNCKLVTIDVSSERRHSIASIHQIDVSSGRQRFSAWLASARRIWRTISRVKSVSHKGSDAGIDEGQVMQSIREILYKQEQATILMCDAQSRTKCTINLWLTQEEFDVLQQESALALIQRWISNLQLDEGWDRRDTPQQPMIAPTNVDASGCSNASLRFEMDEVAGERDANSSANLNVVSAV